MTPARAVASPDLSAARDAAITRFLREEGWAGAARQPLAGDASARRYERLRRGRGTVLLMDVPPESGLRVEPYLAVTAWLRDGGLSAPEVLAARPEDGLVLIEDLGDALFARICADDPAAEPGLYAAAVDLLADLQHRAPPAGPDWVPPAYDRAVLMREARLFVDWYVTAATGAAVPPDAAAAFERAADTAFGPLVGPRVPVIRDYHAENLFWLPDRRGHARVGMIDYQDLLTGHPAYDLVSLLEDARRDTGDALRADMTRRFLTATGSDPDAFAHAAQALAAQRNLKILGLFTRLCRRDSKPRYVDLLPRVWRNLQGDLAHPALAELRDWIARHAPAPEAGVRLRITGAPHAA